MFATVMYVSHFRLVQIDFHKVYVLSIFIIYRYLSNLRIVNTKFKVQINWLIKCAADYKNGPSQKFSLIYFVIIYVNSVSPKVVCMQTIHIIMVYFKILFHKKKLKRKKTHILFHFI